MFLSPNCESVLHEAGVMFVLVPSIPRAHVSGVARWLSSTRPMIQLSVYGKTNDKFWLTFFHEAAHIALHVATKEEKKSVFLDDPNAAPSENPQEHEANRWAGDWLIPPQHASDLAMLRSRAAVEDL